MALTKTDPPALGALPATMRAFVIRPETEGEPETAMRLEAVPVPEPGPDEAIVRVMAAGVNYNGVWAALGTPVSVFKMHREPYHIAGSDASGIVWKVGSNVRRWKPGDEVVLHCNQSCGECAECNGLDPMACSEQRIWGYETSFGSFAQFCRVQSQQLLAKPRHLTWEEAASYGLVYFTAYRMLVDRAHLRAGQHVLVWGGGGGLGSMAVQLCRLYSAHALAVVSSDQKAALCRALGASAVINRSEFDLRKHPGETPEQAHHRMSEMRRFGKRIRELTGGHDVDIVFEHVGSATFPTSVFVCSRFGQVVICGATAGYNLEFDVRYLWMRQKSIIGSHFANAYECDQANQLVIQHLIQPVLGEVFPFEEIPRAHQIMRNNEHAGKMVILVGAPRRGLGAHAG